jgi:hypothetical protein
MVPQSTLSRPVHKFQTRLQGLGEGTILSLGEMGCFFSHHFIPSTASIAITSLRLVAWESSRVR